MTKARPLSFTTAGFLLVVAALGYLGLIALAIPNGRVYLSALGGNEPTSLAAMVAVFGPLAVLAVLLAREAFPSRVGRIAAVGFTAWFIVAALGAVLVEPQVAVGIGLTGLLPLALVWYGTHATR